VGFPRAKIRKKLEDIFGSDLRSLAAFRIGLAVLLLLDLGDRARDLRAHYTDWGVLPRGALLDLFLHPSCFSFHFMNGTWEWQGFLFALTGITALGLLAGYRTRLMTVASWLLLVSVQNRNPLVLQGGDILFRMIFFWAMFLPLGARCSLNRYLEQKSGVGAEPAPRPPVILTWATVAVLIQSVFLYFFAGILKTGPEWTRNDTAVYYAMSIDQLTTPLGHWLLGHPDLMKAMTYLTLKIELFGPLLFFIPVYTGFFRLVAILLLFGMQMGFGATIRVYIFPWICFCATLPMVPTVFWEKLPRVAKAWRLNGLSSAFFTRLVRLLPPKPVSPGTPRWLNITAAFFLVYVILWNMGTIPASLNHRRIDVPRKIKWIGSALRIDQSWNMFAPYPLKDDGWYVIPGTLTNGQEVDVFTGGKPVTWEKPKLVAYTYKNHRWQKSMMNLWSRDFSKFREFYAKYLCRAWNARHQGGERLDRFTIYFMREDTRPDGEAPPEKVNLWEHYCFKVPEKK
jgi:hypothetical protein